MTTTSAGAKIANCAVHRVDGEPLVTLAVVEGVISLDDGQDLCAGGNSAVFSPYWAFIGQPTLLGLLASTVGPQNLTWIPNQGCPFPGSGEVNTTRKVGLGISLHFYSNCVPQPVVGGQLEIANAIQTALGP